MKMNIIRTKALAMLCSKEHKQLGKLQPSLSFGPCLAFWKSITLFIPHEQGS